MDSNKDKDTVAVQMREADRLCDKGIHIDLQEVPRVAQPTAWRRLLERLHLAHPAEVPPTRITIYQPTLATLDRIRPLMLEMSETLRELDKAGDDTILNVAKRSTIYAGTMALIVAHLALGEDYYLYNPERGTYKPDDHALRTLQAHLLHALTPATLAQLLQATLAVCNLADFITSIRLMAAETETVSGRIE